MNIIHELINQGAHFVRISMKGHPIGKEWQNNPLTYEQVTDHLQSQPIARLGLIPASIGCVVIDVDSGHHSTITSIYGLPIMMYESRSKGWHLWYRADNDQPNGLNAQIADCKFDILHHARCAIIYDRSALSNLLGVENYLSIDTQFLFDDDKPTKNWKSDSSNRNNYLLKRARSAKGADELGVLKATAIAAGEEERHVIATIESALKFVQKRIKEQAQKSVEMFDEYKVDSGEEAKQLVRDLYQQGGMGKLDFDVIFKILQLEVRFIPRLSRIEYRKFKTETWKALDDVTMKRIKALIRGVIPKKHVTASGKEYVAKFTSFGTEFDEDFMLYLSKCESDPLAEYFTSLTWDGVARLDRWFIDNMGAPDNAFSRRASSMLFCSIVSRTFTPGCATDTSVVLYGEQGLGKTKTLEALLPDYLSRYIKANLDLSRNPDETVYSIMGKALAIVDEMVDKRGWKLSKIKALLTARDDNVRIKYDRYESDITRYAVFVFTSDEERPLPEDPAGNRRYIPLNVCHQQVDPVIIMTRDRDQLWAEAKVMVENGYKLQLTKEEQIALNIYSSDKTDSDTSVTDAVKSMLNDGASVLWNKKIIYHGEIAFRKEDIVAVLQKHYMGNKVMSDRQFGQQMKKLGWQRRHVRIDGTRQKLWFSGHALDDQPQIFDVLSEL